MLPTLGFAVVALAPASLAPTVAGPDPVAIVEDLTLAEQFCELQREWSRAHAIAADSVAVDTQYYPSFAYFSEEGVARATYWMLRHPLPAAQQSLGSGHADLTVAQRAQRKLWIRLVDQAADEIWLSRERVITSLLAEVPERLSVEQAIEVARRFTQRSETPEIIAEAFYTQGRLMAPWNTVNQNRKAKAIAAFTVILDRYAETAFASLARDARWRLENLSIGDVAPDFVTTDVHGNEIRLSDFRGQVAVVRFWGFWNDRSAAEIEHMRGLVHRMWDQRFILLGINSDASKRDFIAQRDAFDVNWLNAWEGSQSGPIASSWRVREWPTTYVIDAEGVIRGVDVAGTALDAVVDPLVRRVRARLTTDPLAEGSSSKTPNQQ